MQKTGNISGCLTVKLVDHYACNDGFVIEMSDLFVWRRFNVVLIPIGTDTRVSIRSIIVPRVETVVCATSVFDASVEMSGNV